MLEMFRLGQPVLSQVDNHPCTTHAEERHDGSHIFLESHVDHSIGFVKTHVPFAGWYNQQTSKIAMHCEG